MKKQVVVIHGGDVFRSYKEYLSYLKNKKLNFERLLQSGWKDLLQDNLGKGYQVILPKMPNPQNAKYLEWKIWFEKIVPCLDEEIILVGHSLGAIFLVKYLSENKLSRKVAGVFLVAPPYPKNKKENFLGDFAFDCNFEKLEKQAERVMFYHSLDDEVVPFDDFNKYQEDIPGADFKKFKNRGHFVGKTFPEIVADIKKS